MKKYLYNDIEQIVRQRIEFSESEFINLIYKEKPTLLFNSEWHSAKPFIVIQNYKEDGIFEMLCNGEADKTPREMTAKKLYDYLKYQGLQYCFIVTKSEE